MKASAAGPVMPGPDGEQPPLLRRVALDVVGMLRPRADQAHLALDHVEQLRQLVELGPAQEAADARDPRIVAGGHRRALLVGARAHRAQLVDAE